MAFSKTLVGRILPISPPIAEALARRRARRNPTSPLVFHRGGISVHRWRTAWGADVWEPFARNSQIDQAAECRYLRVVGLACHARV